MTQFYYESALNAFNKVTKKPEVFLSSPEQLIDKAKELLKQSYDFSKNEEAQKLDDTLPELIVQNFDLEQIWQQIELQNNKLLEDSVNAVSKVVAAKDRLWFGKEDEEEGSEAEEDIEGEEEVSEAEEEGSEVEENVLESITEDEEAVSDEEESVEEEHEDSEEDKELLNGVERPEMTKTKRSKTSIVDDEFFKLDEMEQFLKNEEKEKVITEQDSENESIDLFEEHLDEEDEEESDSKMNPRYKDFFELADTTSTKKRKRLFEEDEREEVETQPKSSLELREERLKSKIADLEESALQEKPWQLKGEIRADDRPQNSLLEEIVEFDLTSRPAPVITEETNFKLEDVIKQRIKDKAWDDVERKVKLVETPAEYKKKLLLDQEKSKKSLAQIYEDEYVKQKEALDPDAAEKEEVEPKEHTEIKAMMRNLFAKLDSLSNFHFTPKLVAPEARIVSNIPAISMEEVAPVAVSDAALLAPEEVKKKQRGDLIGKDERTDADKKRERRQKKKKQSVHALEKKKRDKLGLGNKYSKQKAARLLEQVTKDRNVDKMDESTGAKGIKSSTSFFAQLQEDVQSQIKSKSSVHKKKTKQIFNATKLKM